MGKFDHSKPLVIDPVIAWATFYGGSQDDEAHSLAIDSQGNPVIAGLTESQDFPGSKYIGIAAYNAFVSKLSADGTRALFTTYIAYGTSGLTNGPNQQVPCVALALDSQDNAYIAGTTSAFGGTVSTTPGAFQQKPSSPSSLEIGYVMKISSDGSRIVYSTLLGSSTQGDVFVMPTGIAVDSSGSAYVSGYEQPVNGTFPTTAGAYQKAGVTVAENYAFVTKFSPDGSSLAYSTVVGGTLGMGSIPLDFNATLAIAVDGSGNAYITGSTHATDFPAVNAVQAKSPNTDTTVPKAFVAELNAAGSALVFSTYFSSVGTTYGRSIAIDPFGNVDVSGSNYETTKITFPLKNPTYSGALASGTGLMGGFVAQFDGSGNLKFSTPVGAAGFGGQAIAAGPDGSIFALGGDGGFWPTASEAPGAHPLWLVKFTPSYQAGWVYGFGSSGLITNAPFGAAVAVDKAGNIYAAGYASTGFPTSGAIQAKNAGNNDAFLARITDTGNQTNPAPTISALSPGYGVAGSQSATVNVYGSSFVSGSVVQWKGSARTTTFVSATQLTATLTSADLSSAGTGAISVSTPSPGGGTSASLNYVVVAKTTAAPVITAVANAAGGQAVAFPGGWVAIYGSNFAPANFTGDWSSSIVNGQLPTATGGVSVTIGGAPAYVYFVSSAQINVVTPNVTSGSQNVVVTTPFGASTAFKVTVQTFSPAFFPWPGGYAVATRQDYSYAVKNGTFAGLTTVPAKPGDILILWATGLGPTSPAVTQGTTVPVAAYPTSNAVQVQIGGITATNFGAALAPGFVGLYQIGIAVPSQLADGDYPIVATVGGVSSPSSIMLTVEH